MNTVNNMNKMTANIADICDEHSTKKDCYCVDCGIAICESCSLFHISNKHSTKKLLNIASEYLKNLMKMKDNYKSLIQDNIKQLNDLRNNANIIKNKITNEIDIELEDLNKIIRSKCFIINEDTISKINLIDSKLLQEDKGDDYRAEIEMLEFFLKNERFTELANATQQNMEDRARAKYEMGEILKCEMREISNYFTVQLKEAKELLESFRLWKKFLIKNDNEVMEIMGKKLKVLKNLDLTLKEHHLKMERQIQLNFDLILESESLKKELQNIKQKLKSILEKYNQAQGILTNLEANCSQFRHNAIMLEGVIADRKYQLASINLLIQNKQIFLDNLDNQIRNKCSDNIKNIKGIVIKRGQKRMSDLYKDFSMQLSEVEIKQEQLLMESKYIYYIDNKELALYIYHTEQHKLFSYTSHNEILPNCDSVQIGNSIYVSGGFNSLNNTFSDIANAYGLMDGKYILGKSLNKMKLAKSHHKLVALDTNRIFCLGGKTQEDKYINYCEEYIINEDKWIPRAILNEKKLSISAAAFDCSIIYAFGGNNGHKLATIESYRPYTEDNKWNKIKIGHNDGWTPRDQIGGYYISSNTILLFGGMDSGNSLLDDSLVFNTVENSITKLNSTKLKKKECFSGRTPIRQENDILLIFGSIGKEIHIFNIKQNTWNILEEQDWGISHNN